MKRPKLKKKVIIWATVLVLVAGYIGYGYYRAATTLPTVTATAARTDSLDAYLSTTGNITPADTRALFAVGQVKVNEVNFEEGDEVKEGDVIATLDLSDLEIQIRQAEFNYQNAQLSYDELLQSEQDRLDKMDELTDEIINLNHRIKYEKEHYDEDSDQKIADYTQRKTALQSQYNTLEAQEYTEQTKQRSKNAVETALLSLQLASKDWDRGEVVADCNGVIASMSLMAGGYTSSATPAVTIDVTDDYRVSFQLSRYDLEKVQEGQKAVVTFAGKGYDGEVSKISRIATPSATGSSLVEAEVTLSDPDDALRLGMEADVDILIYSDSDALVVPVEAVLTDRTGDFCYVLHPDEKEGVYTYEKRYITIGNSSDTHTAILDGLAEGELVVVDPPKDITSMQRMWYTEHDAAADSQTQDIFSAMGM